MNHTAAQILAKLLFDRGIFTDPADGEAWPLFVGHFPAGVTVPTAGVLTDTVAVMDGRLMDGGEVVQHPGIQLRTRDRVYLTAFQKASAASLVLDELSREVVIMEDGSAYYVHAVSRRSSILPMGVDEETRLWQVSCNFTCTISEW